MSPAPCATRVTEKGPKIVEKGPQPGPLLPITWSRTDFEWSTNRVNGPQVLTFASRMASSLILQFSSDPEGLFWSIWPGLCRACCSNGSETDFFFLQLEPHLLPFNGELSGVRDEGRAMGGCVLGLWGSRGAMLLEGLYSSNVVFQERCVPGEFCSTGL